MQPSKNTEAKPTKLTTARRTYRCARCRAEIGRGDQYLTVTVSHGSPSKEVFETRGGCPTAVAHGFRVRTKVCKTCLVAEPPT